MTGRGTLRDLRDGKLVQAVAWLALQVVGCLINAYGWPVDVVRVAPVLLGVGLLAVLVLKWYHREEGLQRFSGIELL